MNTVSGFICVLLRMRQEDVEGEIAKLQEDKF
jgi:hypothetical protein